MNSEIKKILVSSLGNIAYIVIVFAIASLLLKIISFFTKKRIESANNNVKGKVQITQMTLFRSFMRFLLYIVAIALCFSHIGIKDEVASVFVTAGVGGLILSLGTQSVVKDIIAGITIAIEKPFLVGDWIEVAGYEGEVEAISLRNTYLNALGKRIIIPNGKIESVVNYAPTSSYLNISVPIPNANSLEVATKSINEAIKEFYDENKVNLRSLPRINGINKMDRFTFDIAVICETTADSQWEMQRLLQYKIRQKLENNQITF